MTNMPEKDGHMNFNDWNIAEAMLAACSSPFYFPSQSWGEENVLCDGGVSIMNPTEHLIQRATDNGMALEDIHVVSLGTGEFHPDLGIDDKQANELMYWPSKH